MKRELRMILDKYKIYNPDSVKPEILYMHPSETLKTDQKFIYLKGKIDEFYSDKKLDLSAISTCSTQFRRALYRTLASLLNEVMITKDPEQQKEMTSKVYDWYFLKMGLPQVRASINTDKKNRPVISRDSNFNCESELSNYYVSASGIQNGKPDFRFTKSSIIEKPKMINYRGISVCNTPTPSQSGKQTPDRQSPLLKTGNSQKISSLHGKSYKKNNSIFNSSFDKQNDYYSKDRVFCDDLTIIPPIVKVYEKPTLIKKLPNK